VLLTERFVYKKNTGVKVKYSVLRTEKNILLNTVKSEFKISVADSGSTSV
jgi:hypothetical protein